MSYEIMAPERKEQARRDKWYRRGIVACSVLMVVFWVLANISVLDGEHARAAYLMVHVVWLTFPISWCLRDMGER